MSWIKHITYPNNVLCISKSDSFEMLSKYKRALEGEGPKFLQRFSVGILLVNKASLPY